jgi:hypothetical protein
MIAGNFFPAIDRSSVQTREMDTYRIEH